ncbi:MAG TPA: hypothetical protein VFP58_05550 [Candidatus Eisenbacteria bacterium]|nr:hypothetical protein [Candidatus Eisenbacteria bacterium]
MKVQAVLMGVAMFTSVACVAVAQEAAPPPATPPADAPAAQPGDRVAQIKESLAASKAALKSYEWVETTTVSLGGEEKARNENRVYYGAEGTLQKVPLAPDAKEEKKKRGLRGKAVENKKEELAASMKEAVALLRQYAPLDPAKIQAAKDAGNLSISTPAPDGGVKVTIKNYLKAGDEVTIDIDGAKNTLKGFGISSYVGDATAKEKSPVTAAIAYAALPDGTIYPAKESLVISAQKLSVDIQNSGYKKQG